MDSIERRHDGIHDAEQEMKRIDSDAADLQRALDALLSDYGVKYPAADTGSLSADFAARLSDIVDDLQGPAYRRKVRLEDEIGGIEERDLRRSAPMVL